MRKIQQLVYDGKRLFCPDHPNQNLEEGGGTSSTRGPFAVFCGASVGPGLRCMNLAGWPTREDMLRDLAKETINH
jgi:hypothetical protein